MQPTQLLPVSLSTLLSLHRFQEILRKTHGISTTTDEAVAMLCEMGTHQAIQAKASDSANRSIKQN